MRKGKTELQPITQRLWFVISQNSSAQDGSGSIQSSSPSVCKPGGSVGPARRAILTFFRWSLWPVEVPENHYGLDFFPYVLQLFSPTIWTTPFNFTPSLLGTMCENTNDAPWRYSKYPKWVLLHVGRSASTIVVLNLLCKVPQTSPINDYWHLISNFE